jgi:probable HAF family extracellular repeat protein
MYQATSLPSMGGVRTTAHAVNNQGQVLASVRMARDGVRVILWDKSETVRVIESLPHGHGVFGLRMNDAGQVAGTTLDPNRVCRMYLWDPNEGRIVLETPEHVRGEVRGLNNRGQIVGVLHTVARPERAFLWGRSGGMRELRTLGGPGGRACSINDAGQVVGFAQTPDDQWHAVLWKPDGSVIELGISLPKEWTVCHINNGGLVAGHFGSATDITCVSVWDERAGARRLPSIGGDWTVVDALNDANCLLVTTHHPSVKVFGRKLERQPQVYLWDASRGFRRVDARWRRMDIRSIGARDINDEGVMIGSVRLKRGRHHYGVLFEPIR